MAASRRSADNQGSCRKAFRPLHGASRQRPEAAFLLRGGSEAGQSMHDDNAERSLQAEERSLYYMIIDETDRGCVLAGAAFIDEELDALLRAFFVKASNASDPDLVFLFSPKRNGPLSTLGVRVRVANAVGLIQKRTRRAIEALKELRNEFAHFAGPVEMTTTKIQRLMDKLDDFHRNAISDPKDTVQSVSEGISAKLGVDSEDVESILRPLTNVTRSRERIATICLMVFREIREARTIIESCDSLSLPLFPL